MAWVTELPVLFRILPALGLGAALVGVLVFLARHPVDGDQRVIEAGFRHGRVGVVALGLTIFLMVPSWLTLGGLLALVLIIARYGNTFLDLLAARIERNSFI